MLRTLSRCFSPVLPVLLAAVITSGTLLHAQASAPAKPQIAPRITTPVDESARVTLKGTVHPLANARNDAGTADPGTPVQRLQLVLKRSPQQETALRDAIEQLHTPGSPSYHKWLTPAQFGEQFGPADQDLQAIQTWLQSHGFQVLRVSPGKQVLEVSGTAAMVQEAFHTSLHKYVVGGQAHFANATDPQIPAALAPVLGGFVALNNFRAHPLSHFVGKAEYDPATHRAKPEWTVPSGSPLGFDYVVGPEDLATQYDVAPLASAGTDGTGQTIAIINESNINLNFVNGFRSLFKLPANTPQVIIDGNDPGIDGINNPDGPNYASSEAYLDVEWAGAMAPKATVDLVIGADTATQQGLFYAAERAIFSNLAPVMSVSFGQCEANLGASNAFLSQLWEQAAAQGITVLVATGDSGSAGCDDYPGESQAVFGLAVSGFASTPFNVAVGGTDFHYASVNDVGNYWSAVNDGSNGSLKKYAPEQVWNDSQFGLNLLTASSANVVGGGGGASTCGNPNLDANGNVLQCIPYGKPAWQKGVTGIPADKVRDVPDVSLFAGNGLNGSYYAVCAADGDCASVAGTTSTQISGFGGTSVSSPVFAGIMALINQKYGPQGQANNILYPLAVQHAAAFHDVAAGTGAMPCAANSLNCTNGELTGYAAGPGFDLATGLGSIDANELVTHWGDLTFKSTTTTFTPSSTSFTHGTVVSFNTSVTGSGGVPTGDVAMMTDSPLINNQSQAAFPLDGSGNSSGQFAYLPGGSYNVWGHYPGDGVFGPSDSAKTPITVAPESSEISFFVGEITNNGAIPFAGANVPYGTAAVVNVQPVPKSEYNCFVSGSSNCNFFTSPTGTITVTDKGQPIKTITTNGEGSGQFTTGLLAVGGHSIGASYSGDNSYAASTASAVSFNVIKATPQGVSLTPSTNPVFQQGSLTLTALVATGGSGAAPSGTVTFLNNGSSIGTATLSAEVDPRYNVSGVATLSIPKVTFPVGTASITANFAGDANYTSATSGVLALTVNGASGLLASTTTASVAPPALNNTTSPTGRLTVTVTVTGQNNHPAPTGTVDLQISGLNAGSLPLTTTGADTAQVGFQVDSSVLLQGTNAVVLQYEGDSTYAPSQTTVTLNNPLSDFSMQAEASTLTVVTGASGTATIDLSSINGFNNSVALTCGSSTAVTCSVAPGSVMVNGNATATVTVKALKSTSSLAVPRGLGWFAASGGAALAGAFMLGLPARRRKWQSLLGLLVFAVLTSALGCGGGSSSNNGTGGGGSNSGGGGGSTAAPVGIYTVVVTGAQGTAITHNVALTVRVVAGP